VSTLSISIIALVAVVVGLVLAFNLWQARANRRLLREDERFGDGFDASRGRRHPRGEADRAVPAVEARARPAARRWSASEDRNAWAKQRREPTLLADDAPRSTPHAAGPAADFVPHPGPHGTDDYMSAADDDHALEREEREYEAARELVEREDEELLPDPDEDLGPPQFEAPRLGPVPPEPLPSEKVQRAPRLDPARLDTARSQDSRPASGGFESTRPFTPGPADTGQGVAAPVAVNAAGVEALSGSPRSAPAGSTGRGDPGEADPAPQDHLPVYLPADVDYVVTLIPRAPVNAERLIALTSSLRHVGSKAIRIEIDGGQGSWVPLQSGAMVGCLRCSVLLANRQGPLNAVELSDFTAAMESLASQIGARFVPPDLNQVLRQARELDALAARLDTPVDLGVEASAPIPAQKLAAVARKLELFERGGGRYACFAEGGELLFTLMKGQTEDMLAFLLDVPRTGQEHDPWRSMVVCASSCAQLVGGRVVDSAGRGMSVGMIDTVGLQIGKRYQELENAGLRAGSPVALRVFN
jgi:FtsZ-interacting cell division protein ZipA